MSGFYSTNRLKASAQEQKYATYPSLHNGAVLITGGASGKRIQNSFALTAKGRTLGNSEVAAKEAAQNGKTETRRNHRSACLRFPTLEQTKSAVLNTLTSKSGQRSYAHAIDEFVDWSCSEPRLGGVYGSRAVWITRALRRIVDHPCRQGRVYFPQRRFQGVQSQSPI